MPKSIIKLLRVVCVYFAYTSLAYSETPVSGFSNIRQALDLSTRYRNSLNDGSSAWQNIIGIDLHKIFQTDERDIGTLILQPHIVKLDNFSVRSQDFESDNDTELIWRMSNFNYNALASGRLNIRFGHFEVPFGLEQNEDTNGTLRQFTPDIRGIKADWGVSLNGILKNAEYEVALTRGSGIEYSNNGSPYLFTARLGSPSQNNLVIGSSVFYGEIINPDGIVNYKLVGIDASYYLYQWQFSLEVFGGKKDDDEIIHSLSEISWRTPLERLQLYSQLKNSFETMNKQSVFENQIIFGASFDYSNRFNVSAELEHELDEKNQQDGSTNFILQFRMRI